MGVEPFYQLLLDECGGDTARLKTVPTTLTTRRPTMTAEARDLLAFGGWSLDTEGVKFFVDLGEIGKLPERADIFERRLQAESETMARPARFRAREARRKTRAPRAPRRRRSWLRRAPRRLVIGKTPPERDVLARSQCARLRWSCVIKRGNVRLHLPGESEWRIGINPMRGQRLDGTGALCQIATRCGPA